MKRHINSTGRITLPSEAIAINLRLSQNVSTPPSFDARLLLPSNLFPIDSRIYIEAYVRSSMQRFDFGTVGHPTKPKQTVLGELDTGEPIRFRIKIVDEADGTGRIIGWANNIAANSNSGDTERYKSLLPLKEDDLGQRIWAMDTDATGRPMLVINNKIAGLRQRLLSDPILRGSIFPLAMEFVTKLLLEDDESDESWSGEWKEFLTRMFGIDINELIESSDNLDEDRDTAIKNVVDQFCTAMLFADLAACYLNGDQE
ncbi:hypothetical protein [Burkholderia ubonensis]|uniref:hypothetical protein n=1 Tax=Burkholderia ubonensis TaxID=101571 RepID=UPI000A5ADBF7|nr:hypothetical protein [Burkholderia ubonensis]